MIEYRVNVPRGRADLFERAVRRVKDAKILSAKTSRESIVDRYLRRYRRILDKLQEKKTRKVQSGINLGYRKLLEDVLKRENKHRSKLLSPSDQLTNRRFKSLVVSFLEKGMEAKPRFVTVDDQRVGWGVVEGSFDPREGEIIISRYGLVDGNQKSTAEVARSVGLSPKGHAMRYSLIESSSRISYALRKEGLLFAQPSASGLADQAISAPDLSSLDAEELEDEEERDL